MLAARRTLLSLLATFVAAAYADPEKCATDLAGSVSGQAQEWTELMGVEEVEHTVIARKVCEDDDGKLIGLTLTACDLDVAPLVDASTGEVHRQSGGKTVVVIHASAYCGYVAKTRSHYVPQAKVYRVLRYEAPRPRVTKLLGPSLLYDATDAYTGYDPYSYEPGSRLEREGNADKTVEYEDGSPYEGYRRL